VEQYPQIIFSQLKITLYLALGFTLLAFLSQGRKAFHWSPELRRSAVTNLLLSNFGGINAFLYVLTIAPLVALYGALNLPVLPAETWTGWPIVLKALLALLVYDTTLYFVHRILHTSWLWPSHAVHHSDPELHFLSWSRGHFIEQIVIAGSLVFTMTWMGFGLHEIYGLALIKALHQHYVHAKLDWDHGPFKYLLVSPQFHRWHHANVEAAYDKNFATIFPFLDLAFGTYYNPGSAIDAPTGIADAPSNDFVTQILYPFRQWAGMMRNGRVKRARPAG
jgi:sterol desaturase/sphingolipid hydroxylase (fatty acid hydroxylase superfamily)